MCLYSCELTKQLRGHSSKLALELSGKNTLLSLSLDGQNVSVLAGTPNTDLCVKCDLETIAAVTKFIVVRGFSLEHSTRKYEKKNKKDDDDDEHEGDDLVQKKPKKSRRSSSSAPENTDVAHIEI